MRKINSTSLGISQVMSPWRRFFNSKEASSTLPTGYSTYNTNLINAVYYPNWSVYNAQAPSSLNLEAISHIFYAFAWVHEDGSVYLSDEYADTQIQLSGAHGCFDDLRSVKRHYPHVKTVLSLGGGGKGSVTFPTVASNEESRIRCAKSAEEMCTSHGFDGIDLDWEHPSSSQQGLDYVKLLECLRRALPAPRLLTSALPAGAWALKHINLLQAATYLDYINLMTYDFTGPWTSVCGHHAQLYTPNRPHNDASRISCSSAVAYVTSRGVPSSQVLLGIPTYGRSFLEAKTVGESFRGHAGEEGTFKYKDLPRPKTREEFDDNVGAAFCIGGDGGFVSYDNTQSVLLKAEFAKSQKLGGLFYWTATGDTNDSRSLIKTGWKSLRCSEMHK